MLAVDGDDLMHDILYDGLLTEDHQVHLASDGNAALAVQECERNLVILLDLTMPGLPGEGVLDVLQAQQRSDHRIVAITAGRHPTRERCRVQQGLVRAVVHKPFTIGRLLTLLHQATKAYARSTTTWTIRTWRSGGSAAERNWATSFLLAASSGLDASRGANGRTPWRATANAPRIWLLVGVIAFFCFLATAQVAGGCCGGGFVVLAGALFLLIGP